MSNIKLSTTGKDQWLTLIVAPTMTLRLFTNDVEAGLSDAQIAALAVSDFTEATFTGYAAVNLTSGNWTISSGIATYTEQTFTRSSDGTAENILGYWIERDSDNELIIHQQLDSPIIVEFTDDGVRFIPTIEAANNGGDTMPAGTSLEFAGSVLPDGYLWEDGSAVSRTTYAGLFAIIGTTYGVGDGSTTFNLPDRRGKFGIGKSTSGTAAVLGETGGAIDHVHGLDTTTSGAAIFVASAGNDFVYQARKTIPSTTLTHRAPSGGTNGVSSGASTVGAQIVGDSDTANGPYITKNYIIKT